MNSIEAVRWYVTALDKSYLVFSGVCRCDYVDASVSKSALIVDLVGLVLHLPLGFFSLCYLIRHHLIDEKENTQIDLISS